jgi:hypothetical protein
MSSRVQNCSRVQEFKSSRVQGSRVQEFKGSRFKGSRVQGSRVQGFKVQYFDSVQNDDSGLECEVRPGTDFLLTNFIPWDLKKRYGL